MNGINKFRIVTIEDPDYESGGRGVIVLSLTAALTTLLLIVPIVIKALTTHRKTPQIRKN